MELKAPLEPRHSRPIDVHRWSDHPEVRFLVDQLWEEHFADYAAKERVASGAKAKMRHRDQLRVILLDLYVAWLTDPDLSIGYHQSLNAWNTNSRYNALHLSRVIPDLIRRLSQVGLVEVSGGSYSGPGAKSNRTARMRPYEPLRALFREAKFGRQHIRTVSDRECIILKASDDLGGREKAYQDNEHTTEMRRTLTRYNQLLARTFIDLPDHDQSFVERPITTGPQAGRITRVPIGTQENFVRRIFNRGSFDCGGRFYGGWWQHVDSELRKRIHINGVPTIEVDYQALHVAILSAGQGRQVGEDPYVLDPDLLPDMKEREQRSLVKLLVLMAFNAKSPRAAFSAFRQDQRQGSTEKSMKNLELQVVLDAFVEKNPHLADAICSDQGIKLMNTDSRIAEIVINRMTAMRFPVLCIHDSFIVDYNHAIPLKLAMDHATRAVLGKTVATQHNYIGLDECRRDDPARVDDYIEVRHRDPTPGYLARKRLFDERMVYLGERSSKE